MRLRVVRCADTEGQPGAVQFGGDTGMPREEWLDGIVVMVGQGTTIFHNGDARFYDIDGEPFTPRVEDWSAIEVLVELDVEVQR